SRRLAQPQRSRVQEDAVGQSCRDEAFEIIVDGVVEFREAAPVLQRDVRALSSDGVGNGREARDEGKDSDEAELRRLAQTDRVSRKRHAGRIACAGNEGSFFAVDRPSEAPY